MNAILLTSVLLVALFVGGCAPVNANQPPPQPIVITVVVQPPPPQPTVPLPQPIEPLPQLTAPPLPQPTLPPQPTPTPLVSKVFFQASRDLSCAEGPDWQLYWLLKPLRQGQQVEVLAQNGGYGLVDFEGDRCWVLLSEGILTGDVNSLPFQEAPPLPMVTFQIINNLGTFIHLRFYEWYTGRQVHQVDLGNGQTKTVTIPSGFYAVIGYDTGWNAIYVPGEMINLAAGDTYHLKGLRDGTAILELNW